LASAVRWVTVCLKKKKSRGTGYVSDTSSQTRWVHHPRHRQTTGIRLLKHLTGSGSSGFSDVLSIHDHLLKLHWLRGCTTCIPLCNSW
jgi:hypothetical protein